MPTKAHVLLLGIALGLLSACNPAVQARHRPTSVDEVFGSFSKIGDVDDEVYQLPASPPDILATSRLQRPCRPPGQLMKPTTMAAFEQSHEYQRASEPTLMAAMEEPPMMAPGPGQGYPLAAWEPTQQRGAKESTPTPPFIPLSQPGRSLHRNESTPISAWDSSSYSWCNPEANTR